MIVRTFDTQQYGTVQICAVNSRRVYFDAFSPGLQLTVGAKSYVVSLSMDKLDDGSWIVSDDGRGIADERLRFVCRPADSRDDASTELPAGSPIRAGVISNVVPRIVAWADHATNRRDFLVAEREQLQRSLKTTQARINQLNDMLVAETAFRDECRTKLDAVIAALNG